MKVSILKESTYIVSFMKSKYIKDSIRIIYYIVYFICIYNLSILYFI